jgi:hypothetical protein
MTQHVLSVVVHACQRGQLGEAHTAPAHVVARPGGDAVKVAGVVHDGQRHERGPVQHLRVLARAEELQAEHVLRHHWLGAEVQHGPARHLVLAGREARHAVAVGRARALRGRVGARRRGGLAGLEALTEAHARFDDAGFLAARVIGLGHGWQCIAARARAPEVADRKNRNVARRFGHETRPRGYTPSEVPRVDTPAREQPATAFSMAILMAASLVGMAPARPSAGTTPVRSHGARVRGAARRVAARRPRGAATDSPRVHRRTHGRTLRAARRRGGAAARRARP